MSAVTIAKYLSTSYEPECEFVNGRLENRHAGLKTHSVALGSAMLWLFKNVHSHSVVPILRIRTSPMCVRVADICVIPRDINDEVPTTPPALWVEILSPDDRWSRLHRKLTEILTFGVPTIWIIDPYERQAWIGTPQTGIFAAEDNVLRCENLNLHVALEEILPAN